MVSSPLPQLPPPAGRGGDRPAAGGGRWPRSRRQAPARPTPTPTAAEIQLEFDWGVDLDVVRMQVREKLDQVAASSRTGHRTGPGLLLQHQRHPGGPGPHLGRGRGPLAELRPARGASRQPAAPRSRRGPGRPLRGRAAADLRRPRLDPVKAHRVDVGALIARLAGASANMALGQRRRATACATGARLAASASLTRSAAWSSTTRGSAWATSPRSATRSRRSTTAATSTAAAIALDVFKESTANTVEVVRAVQRVIDEEIAADPLLEGINLFVWQDQAEEITLRHRRPALSRARSAPCWPSSSSTSSCAAGLDPDRLRRRSRSPCSPPAALMYFTGRQPQRPLDDGPHARRSACWWTTRSWCSSPSTAGCRRPGRPAPAALAAPARWCWR